MATGDRPLSSPSGTWRDRGRLEWNGERLFQAARFATEMQYQHLVFEEFARKVQPSSTSSPAFRRTSIPAIVAEFAHQVYRFGHSMLTETVVAHGCRRKTSPTSA